MPIVIRNGFADSGAPTPIYSLNLFIPFGTPHLCEVCQRIVTRSERMPPTAREIVSERRRCFSCEIQNIFNLLFGMNWMPFESCLYNVCVS